MSVLPLVLLALLELEDDDLLAATLLDDLAEDLGTRNEGAAELGGVAAEEENFVERDLVASGAFELLDFDEIARGDAVLLAAGADNCV